MSRKNLYIVSLGVWIWLLLLLNLAWLATDRTPPAWDQAAHIRSIIYVNHWLKGTFWGNFTDLIRTFWGYPPLLYFLGGVWSLVLGVSVFGITLINSVFLAGAVAGVFVLAREVTGSEGKALLAGIIFSMFPAIYDISRNMLLDLPLLVWVVWGLYFFIRSDGFLKKSWVLGWTLCLILAALTKLNGFIYFAPMVVWAFYKSISLKEIKIFRNLIVVGLVFAGAVSWWWVLNFANIWEYLTGLAGQGEKLTDPQNLFQWQTWIHYFRLFFQHQAGPVAGIVFLICLNFWKEVRLRKEGKPILGWFLVFNYVVFTVIRNKDFRFTLPLLIAAAIIMAVGMTQVWREKKSWGRGMAILLFLWLSWHFINNSFNWPIKKDFVLASKTFVLGDLEWVGLDNYPVRSPSTEGWPQKQIVTDLYNLGQGEGKTVRVLMLVNREEVNDNNLGMYREMYSVSNFEPGSVGMREKFNSEEETADLISGFDAVLLGEKDWEPAPFYSVNLTAVKQARDWVWQNREQFEVLAEYQAFGDKKLYLLHQKTRQ